MATYRDPNEPATRPWERAQPHAGYYTPRHLAGSQLSRAARDVTDLRRARTLLDAAGTSAAATALRAWLSQTFKEVA